MTQKWSQQHQNYRAGGVSAVGPSWPVYRKSLTRSSWDFEAVLIYRNRSSWEGWGIRSIPWALNDAHNEQNVDGYRRSPLPCHGQLWHQSVPGWTRDAAPILSRFCGKEEQHGTFHCVPWTLPTAPCSNKIVSSCLCSTLDGTALKGTMCFCHPLSITSFLRSLPLQTFSSSVLPPRAKSHVFNHKLHCVLSLAYSCFSSLSVTFSWNFWRLGLCPE